MIAASGQVLTSRGEAISYLITQAYDGNTTTIFQLGQGLRTGQSGLTTWEDRPTGAGVTVTVSLLDPIYDQLRSWLVEHWCHRTGKRSRETPTPLYRLRSALSRLWLAYPSRSPVFGNSG